MIADLSSCGFSLLAFLNLELCFMRILRALQRCSAFDLGDYYIAATIDGNTKAHRRNAGMFKLLMGAGWLCFSNPLGMWEGVGSL